MIKKGEHVARKGPELYIERFRSSMDSIFVPQIATMSRHFTE